jgi:hypothetical protein
MFQSSSSLSSNSVFFFAAVYWVGCFGAGYAGLLCVPGRLNEKSSSSSSSSSIKFGFVAVCLATGFSSTFGCVLAGGLKSSSSESTSNFGSGFFSGCADLAGGLKSSSSD